MTLLQAVREGRKVVVKEPLLDLEKYMRPVDREEVLRPSLKERA